MEDVESTFIYILMHVVFARSSENDSEYYSFFAKEPSFIVLIIRYSHPSWSSLNTDSSFSK